MITPDANLLLYAYDAESPFHRAAAKWWAGLLSANEPVGLCPVVVFAFLRLSTHPKVFERPLTVVEASRRIASWLARPNVRLLVAGPSHVGTVSQLLTAAGTAGNLVTDAQIAALAMEYGATVHTADTDFARFKDVNWENRCSSEGPQDLPPPAQRQPAAEDVHAAVNRPRFPSVALPVPVGRELARARRPCARLASARERAAYSSGLMKDRPCRTNASPSGQRFLKMPRFQPKSPIAVL